MSVLCRLGWHHWRVWKPARFVHRYLVRSALTGMRMPDNDFDEIHMGQVRTCRRCGLQETRR